MELRKIRTLKGLTQQQVADGIQCSSTVYARYERGEREPSIDTLLRLSAFLKVTVDCLLGNNGSVPSTLTEYELNLVLAAREADGRAREDALSLLLAHKAKRPTGFDRGRGICYNKSTKREYCR